MKNTTVQPSALRAAFPATVPVLTGYLCLGFAYGVLDIDGMKSRIHTWTKISD